MIFELLLALSLFYGALNIPTAVQSAVDNPVIPPHIQEVINDVQETYHQVLTSLNRQYPTATPRETHIRVFPTNTVSRIVNKSQIYLCLQRPNGELYNRNTIIRAAIHELAHLLCGDENHTPSFYLLEEKLLEIAQDLRKYTPKLETDPSYPCVY